MSIELFEIVLFWLAVAFYAAASVLIVIGLLWSNTRLQKISHLISLSALVPHGVALIIRWDLAGRAPYQDLYEKFSFDAWWGIMMFMVLIRIWSSLRPLASIVYPVTLILMGWAVLSSKEITDAPATYQTVWLVIHVIFAKLSYGSALLATATSFMYLVKKEKYESRWQWIANLPSQNRLDYYSYRLTAFAFLMIGIMIVTGSIWAHQAWGRYWFWDPIETWSLISWLCYGFYLHFRLTGGKPRVAAIINIISLFTLLITFFVLPYLYDSVHRS